MIATQYFDELKLAFTPFQWQQGNTKSQKNFLGPHHQSKPQPSIVRAGFHYCGELSECSSQNFRNHFGPKTNIDTGMQQYLNCARLLHMSTAAYQRGRFGVAAQTFPFQDQCSVKKKKIKTSSSQDVREGNHQDFKSLFTVPTSTSETSILDERHCKTQQIQISQAPLYFGQTRMQNINNVTVTHPSPYQQHVSSPSLSSQPSRVKVLPGQERMITDEEIHAFIAKRTAEFRKVLSLTNRNYGHTSSNIDANTTAVVTQALQDNSSNGSKANVEPTPESKGGDDCATSASEKHSTECPQIMMKVAATCTKNEDEITTTVPGVTLDELTDEQPSSTSNCSPSPEEYKSLRLDINKTMDELDQVPDVSKTLRHITERDKVDRGIQTVERIEFDGMNSVANVSQDFQTKSASEKRTFEPVSPIDNQESIIKESEGVQQRCRVSNRKVISHSKLNSSPDKFLIHDDLSAPTSQHEWLGKRRSCEHLSEDVGSVVSPTDLNIALSENKVKEQACHLEGVSLKNPEYEDISENEEMPQLATKLCHPPFSPYFKDVHYEDISEDENQKTENLSLERPSLKQVAELKNVLSVFTNSGSGHAQVSAQMNQEIISDEELIQNKQVSSKTETFDSAQHSSCPRFDESYNGNHFVSPSSAVLNNDYESDDQIDDDWIVIPIIMPHLVFEPECEYQDDLEAVTLDNEETEVTEKKCDTSQTPRPSTQPVPPSAYSKIEVFETVDSFEQANKVYILDRFEATSSLSISDEEIDDEGEPHVPMKSKELYSDPDDSYDTDDSMDYPSGPKYNFLTGSKQLLERSFVPLTTAAVLTAPDKEGEDDTVTNVQNGQTSLNKFSENECQHSQVRRHSSERVDTHFQRNNMPSANIQAPQCQSESVKHKTDRQNISNNGIIIIDSDSQNESEQNCQRNAKRIRFSSSVSDESGDFTCNDRLLPQCPIILSSDSENDINEKCNNANRKRLFTSGSADCSESPCAQQKTLSPGSTGYDVSHSENGQQTEAIPGSEHVQNKIHSKTMSADKILSVCPVPDKVITKKHLCKRPARKRRILSLESEDSDDDALFVRKKRRLGELPDRPNCLKLQHQTPKNPTANSKKNAEHFNSNDHATKNNVQANNVQAKPTLVSRKSSLSNQKSQSTSNSDLSFPGGPHTEAKQSLNSLNNLGEKSGETSAQSSQNTSVPRQHLALSKLQRSHSYGNSSTSGHLSTPLEDPSSSATLQPRARTKVIEDWEKNFPNMRDRKSSLGIKDNLRTLNNESVKEVRPKPSHYESSREPRPGPSHYERAHRKRQNSLGTAAPLMKKTMSDYLQWPKANHRDLTREERCSVSEGYKWSEKPKPKKDPSRQRK